MNTYKKINGPINIVRLEGKIYGIKKIIYLFMDKHLNVDNQTKCQEYLSDDVVVYLHKEFKKIKDKNIDFFVEIYHEYKSNKDNYELVKNNYIDDDIYKDNYIKEVIKFFYKYIKKVNDKNIGTHISNKIRFHYIDIRNYIKNKFDDLIYDLMYITNHLNNNIIQIKPINKLKKRIKIINEIIKNIDVLIKIINNPDIKKTKDNDLLELNYIIDKIKNKYNHNEVKESCNEILTYLVSLFDDMKSTLISLDKNLNIIIDVLINDNKKDINEILKESRNMIYKINYDNLNIFSRLMDIYFIRRILDKDYITNCVVYSGGDHSLFYVLHLVKNFDFIITHSAKIKDNYILKDVNNELKNNDKINIDYLYDVFPLENDILQCSDLSTFPENFN